METHRLRIQMECRFKSGAKTGDKIQNAGIFSARDVDTAAARLKRYYEFISFDELKLFAKKIPVGNGQHQQYLTESCMGGYAR